MNNAIVILAAEAIAAYLLVLWAHSLRTRMGLGPFYALLGGLTAAMSWITDAGLKVQMAGITFVVGSTVFYTALILGVFVVYVFDGPHSTRIAILAVAGVSALLPIIAAVLHAQMGITGEAALRYIPVPSLRINTASVATTICDLIFLAMAWEFLGTSRLRIGTGLRTFATLLGVMWLDVLLFATGAFAGTPGYVSIMQGTLLSRLVMSVFAFPFLLIYLNWQNREMGAVIENRPILAILREVDDVRTQLDLAKREIERRKRAEQALQDSEARYRGLFDYALSGVAVYEIITDSEGKPVDYIFLEVNPAFELQTGLRPDQVIGKRATQAVPELKDAPFVEIYGNVALTGKPVEFEEFSEPLNRHYQISAFSLGEGQFATVFRDITERKQADAERERLIARLQDALAQVKQLSGMLPICASCKKIRDDAGYWHNVEEYVRDHSNAEFSHGLCPDCARKLYPEMFDEE